MKESLQYITASEEGFKNELLDKLLEAGFYRMQHLMFTCNETVINSDWKVIPVFWLRTLVNKYKLNGTAKKILRQCAGFSVSVHAAYIDGEIEALYTAYKDHVQFEVSSSCASYLHQKEFPHPFNSMMLKVHHHKQLIAVGYFDEGYKSIAGIMNIYHPQYRSYSLGKFLMLQKLQYALSQNMQFYYTGYVSPESARFDYKVFPDPTAVQVLLPVQNQWVSYNVLGKSFLSEYYATFFQED